MPGDVVTVTSENLQEFVLGKTQEMPKDEKKDVEAKEEKNTEEKIDEKAEKKSKLQERFRELTDYRRKAEEERDAARRELEELKAKVNPPKQDYDPEIGPKPKASEYTDIEEYSKDLEEWKEKDTEKRLKLKAEKEKQERAAKKVEEQWQKNLAEFKKEVTDYEEAIMEVSDKAIEHPAARDALIKSEFGPQILYHLAKNPELVDKLNEQDAVDAVRMIGRLESRFEKKAEKEEKTEVKTERKVLPEPTTPIRGMSVTDSKLDAQGNFQGSYQEYKALRLAKKL